MELSEKEQKFLSVMERIRQIDLRSPDFELTRGEFHLLAFILIHRAGSGVTVSEAAGELRTPMPAVSRLLRGLERKGLIERSINRADRRSIIIIATPAGKACMEGAFFRVHAFWDRVLDRFSEEELDRLLSSWNGLLDVIESVSAENHKEDSK